MCQDLAIVLIVAGVLGWCTVVSATPRTLMRPSWADRAVGKGKATGQRPGLGRRWGIVVGGALLLFSRRRTSSCIEAA